GLMKAVREAEDAAMRGEPYDVLLAWDLDRWSRADSWRTGTLMARLMDASVTQVITNAEGTLDLADETQRVMFNLKQDLGRNAYHHGGHHRAGMAGVKKDASAPAREARRRRGGLKHLPRETNAPEDVVVVKNAHPALVSAEDFAAAGRTLSARFSKPSGRGAT